MRWEIDEEMKECILEFEKKVKKELSRMKDREKHFQIFRAGVDVLIMLTYQTLSLQEFESDEKKLKMADIFLNQCVISAYRIIQKNFIADQNEQV